VVLHFAPEVGPPEELLHRLRCRRAWAAVHGLERAADDPLALRRLFVVVRSSGSGVEVMLTVSDLGEVPELLRRAQAALAARTGPAK